MASVKHKYNIDKTDFPTDGYKFNVQVLISVDGGNNFYFCGLGKFCKSDEEAAEYIEQQKRKYPDTEAEEPERKKQPERINSMCLNCGNFGVDCKGTTDQRFTGCIYRTIDI